MTAAKKKTEVAKVEGGAVAVIPDFMKKDAGKGVENLSSADLEIPRLQLLQSLSPQDRHEVLLPVKRWLHRVEGI